MSLMVIGACCVMLRAAGQSAPAAAEARTRPVLVELFTSEGCSDCPPADKLLEQLDKTQPVPGTQAIVLSEHVTYWNRQGWTDPFSMDEVTDRQQDYGRRFNLNDVYTPQMVVDGAIQFVGSDGAALQRALTAESSKPGSTLAIGDARWKGGIAYFSVHGAATPGTKLFAALAADATHSEVARGENAGRTLYHVAVVRAMADFNADAVDGRELRIPGRALASKEESKGPVRLVVWLTDRKTGHVLGAAEQTISR